jgi:SAM-dependent methyltransferase
VQDWRIRDRRRSPLAGAARWEERYRTGNTPWDRGRPAAALLDLLERLTGRSLAILVPGAGHGRDAVAWAAAGHEVTALDHAPTALELCHQHAREANVRLRVVLADVLHLPRDLVGAFDAIWEQTCFCALPPAERRAYASAMARALRPGGHLYGLFWRHGRRGGPPYDVTEACVRAIFEDCFEVVSLRSVPRGLHRRCEFVAVLRRKGWRARSGASH